MYLSDAFVMSFQLMHLGDELVMSFQLMYWGCTCDVLPANVLEIYLSDPSSPCT